LLPEKQVGKSPFKVLHPRKIDIHKKYITPLEVFNLMTNITIQEH
jgi:hypothetical protein